MLLQTRLVRIIHLCDIYIYILRKPLDIAFIQYKNLNNFENAKNNYLFKSWIIYTIEDTHYLFMKASTLEELQISHFAVSGIFY